MLAIGQSFVFGLRGPHAFHRCCEHQRPVGGRGANFDSAVRPGLGVDRIADHAELAAEQFGLQLKFGIIPIRLSHTSQRYLSACLFDFLSLTDLKPF